MDVLDVATLGLSVHVASDPCNERSLAPPPVPSPASHEVPFFPDDDNRDDLEYDIIVDVPEPATPTRAADASAQAVVHVVQPVRLITSAVLDVRGRARSQRSVVRKAARADLQRYKSERMQRASIASYTRRDDVIRVGRTTVPRNK